MKTKWWQKSVVYQIYPKSFYDTNDDGIGDLNGVIEKLDYLQFLGIDLIWLSPVYESPMDDNGYDISNYIEIAEQFGTMGDMERLIEEASKRDIGIIMDLVINHTSDEHEWFLESKSSKENKKRDWYIWKDPKADGSPPNNWRSVFGGSVWQYDKKTNQYYLHCFSKKQPDLNWENHHVRKALYEMIKWWLDKGIAGFRVDAITFIKKKSDFASLPTNAPDGMVPVFSVSVNQPGIHDFLSELKKEAFEKYDIVTVAEAPGVSEQELETYVGADGHFDMLFEFNHVDLDLGSEGKWIEPKEWSLQDLKEAINKSQHVLNRTGWGALYIENHDQPRSFDKFIAKSTIDQKAQKMLAVLYFFLKGTPFIYQGQEIGMTNVAYPSIDDYNDIGTLDQYRTAIKDGYSEEEALKAVWRRSRDNARTPMQWNDQEYAGFSSQSPWLKVNPNYKTVNVEKAMQQPESLLHFYRQLIHLRKNSEYKDVIQFGDYQPVQEQHSDIFAYTRSTEEKTLLVVCNFYEKDATIALDHQAKKIVLSNYMDSSIFNGSLTLRSYEAIIYELEYRAKR